MLSEKTQNKKERKSQTWEYFNYHEIRKMSREIKYINSGNQTFEWLKNCHMSQHSLLCSKVARNLRVLRTPINEEKISYNKYFWLTSLKSHPGGCYSCLFSSVLSHSLMECLKMSAIIPLIIFSIVSTLCESYKPSLNHFNSCSLSDKVTFILDEPTFKAKKIFQGCHCGPTGAMCSKTGYPGTQGYSGCIRKDHTRFQIYIGYHFFHKKSL